MVYFLKYYIFILNPSGRSLLWLCTRRYSRLEREASDNPGSVCVEHEKCGSFHGADDRKTGLGWVT